MYHAKLSGVFYRGGGPWTDYSNRIGPASALGGGKLRLILEAKLVIQYLHTISIGTMNSIPRTLHFVLGYVAKRSLTPKLLEPSSWEEQRHMINESAFTLLSIVDPAASRQLDKELALLSPELPSVAGLQARWSAAADGVCTGSTLELKNGPALGNAQLGWQLALSCSGAIVSLNRSTPSTHSAGDGEVAEFASVSNPLALVVIPGQPTPKIQALWTDSHTGTLVAKMVTNDTTSGPASLPLYQHWMRLEFGRGFVNVSVWLGKAPDVINGAAADQQVYLLFNPLVNDPNDYVMDQQGVLQLISRTGAPSAITTASGVAYRTLQLDDMPLVSEAQGFKSCRQTCHCWRS